MYSVVTACDNGAGAWDDDGGVGARPRRWYIGFGTNW